MIAHHHERWDGSGYPYGLRGEFIPFGARILAVADVFEAIRVPHVRDRSLRDRIALRILQVASGTQFDPCVVDALIELMGEMETMDSRGATHR
jgi:HD-GYP domain-containing protein (c-di-GMP phosphodiesterase class II)